MLTIHNLGYQGWFDKEELYQTQLGPDVFHDRGLEAFDRINLLKGGIAFSTLVTTVSPRYAREIQTPEGGEGLDSMLRDRGSDVIGILNGIDDAIWNPATDRYTARSFSAADLSGKALCKAALQAEVGLPQRPDVPLLGLVSRLAEQKGIDIVVGASRRSSRWASRWWCSGRASAGQKSSSRGSARRRTTCAPTSA